MSAIYKRELSSYFNSMTGYLCVAAMVAFIGIYFMAYNLFSGYPYFGYSLASVLFIFMVIVPILTMRSMAEERHSRTDQLLLTAPVSVTEVVIGKYLAMLTVYLIPVLIACFCPLIIELNGTAYLKADYSALLAFFLYGAVEISVGLLISSLTESQIIAAVGTFGALLVLYLWDGLIEYLPTSASGSLVGLLVILLLVCLLLQSLSNNYKVSVSVGVAGAAVILGFYLKDSDSFSSLLPSALGKFSLSGVFTNFVNNQVFDVAGLLMYLSVAALMVFLTVQVVQKRRWS